MQFHKSGKSVNAEARSAECAGWPGISRECRTLDDFDERTKADMDIVLEDICSKFPNGGDHDSRRLVAEHLIAAARAGKTTLAELTHAGRRALTLVLNKSR